MIISVMKKLIKALINLSSDKCRLSKEGSLILNGRGYGEGFLEQSVVFPLAIRIAENAAGVRVSGTDVV